MRETIAIAAPAAITIAAALTAAALAGGCALAESVRQQEDSYVEGTLAKVNNLVQGTENELSPFVPKIWPGPYFARRHTPMIYASAPWQDGDECWIEVPEYAWAHVPGDPHNGSPFYYGRDIGTNKSWSIRYPSQQEPLWRPLDGGGLAIDNPLEGGYVVRFRVLPHDRMIEVRFGITNDSDKPVTDVRCQLCMMPHKIASLAERWPTSSKMLAGGEVISWDAAGQDLSWLDPYRTTDGRFKQSCFFLAPVAGHLPDDWDTQKRRYGSVMWLDKVVDIPAVAKCNSDETDCLIVYSPFGRNAFYNCLVPCFHADPHMDLIPPGETRWTTSYYLMFAGDLKTFLTKLAALHAEIRRGDGVEWKGF